MTKHAATTRRLFLKTTAVFLPSLGFAQAPASVVVPTVGAADAFPNQDPQTVADMVAAAHGNLPRVQALLRAHPALSRATIDWGFGDWESALDGAAHIGHREIAELLLANGARPTIFAAAMLGQLDVVSAFLTASPGIERIKGPHGITLMRHAAAGGARAQAVVDYLKTIPGADERLAAVPLSQEEGDRLIGTYALDAMGGPPLRVERQQAQLMIGRGTRAGRGLFHRGNFEFAPAGASDVRIRFTVGRDDVSLQVIDGEWVVTARRPRA